MANGVNVVESVKRYIMENGVGVMMRITIVVLRKLVIDLRLMVAIRGDGF
jgi:hypothetical protein